METDSNVQGKSRQYLDELETLQKEHYNVLRAIKPNLVFDDEVRRLLDMLPSYNALYSFAIRMIKTLKQMRSQLLEKSSSLAQIDLELLQTQSSLLLAHAAAERRRIELRFYADTRSFRRHSWHGQDLLQKLANEEMSFYLPFKLHGSRMRKPTIWRNSEILGSSDSFPEAELIQLFKAIHTTSEPTAVKQATKPTSTQLPHSATQVTKPDKIKYRQKPLGPTRRPPPRPPPIYECVPLASMPAPASRPVSFVEENYTRSPLPERSTLMDSAPMLQRVDESPSDEPPSPLPLGNAGQVRALTQAFECPRLRRPPVSAPVSPTKTGPNGSRITPPTRFRPKAPTPVTSSEDERRACGYASKARTSHTPSRSPPKAMDSSLQSSGSLWSITQERVTKKLFQRRGVARMPRLAGFPVDSADRTKQGPNKSRLPTPAQNTDSREKRTSWMEKLRSKR